MQTLNTYYTSDKQLNKFIKNNQIKDDTQLLIQVFTSNCDANFILRLITFFKKNFPFSSLIGSTTDGEICDGNVSTKKTVISFSLFEKTTLLTHINGDFENYFEAGKSVANKIVKEDTKAIISFIDGLSGNGEEYLEGINTVNPNVIVAGGLAGDNSLFNKTYVFTKEKVLSDAVVAVSLSSSSLHIFTDYSFDWQPVGKVLTITKAEKNRIYKIDDKTAQETYRYYLGENISNQLPQIAIEFPLIIQKENITIARAPIAKKDDGSLIFAANLKVGDKVRFGCADFNSILDQTQDHLNKLYKKSVETIFMYSCMARRRFMPREIEYETFPYDTIAPTSGFYTYGEFFSISNHKEMLNQSMTILAISESDSLNDLIQESETIEHENMTLQALSHLINVSTKELDEAQKELKILSITDPLTKLYNRRYFTDISDDIFKISKRDNTPLSIVMFDIDKFKNINDSFGHKIGDKTIVQFAITLKKMQRNSDISCRYGGEEFVILLPNTKIEGAIIVAENIRKRVERSELKDSNNKIVQFSVSAGVSEVDFSLENNIEKALNNADKALYLAKHQGRNMVLPYQPKLKTPLTS